MADRGREVNGTAPAAGLQKSWIPVSQRSRGMALRRVMAAPFAPSSGSADPGQRARMKGVMPSRDRAAMTRAVDSNIMARQVAAAAP